MALFHSFLRLSSIPLYVYATSSLSTHLSVDRCPVWLWDPMDCSLPASSVYRIFQQEYWSRVPFPSGPRERTRVSCIAGRRLTIWATRETISGYLGCFQVLVIVHGATMNIEVHVSFWIGGQVFSGYIYSGVELLDHTVTVFVVS